LEVGDNVHQLRGAFLKLSSVRDARVRFRSVSLDAFGEILDYFMACMELLL
jgi:hypothetical protein